MEENEVERKLKGKITSKVKAQEKKKEILNYIVGKHIKFEQ